MALIAVTLLAPLLGGLALALWRPEDGKVRSRYVEAVTLLTSLLALSLCFLKHLISSIFTYSFFSLIQLHRRRQAQSEWK